MTLRLALVGGPMYDGLYELLDRYAPRAEIIVHADHVTLNREVTRLLQAGERVDVLSTHSKYAPSQQEWLLPLDGVVDPGATGRLDDGALGLCSFNGRLLSIPRNIDVRTLWWRTDRMEAPPATWDDVGRSGLRWGFPGRDSGLFGTFFEIVVANGGSLFDGATPLIEGPGAVEAVETICRLAARCPADQVGWHYDEVTDALLGGRVDVAGLWPGASGSVRSSPLAGLLSPALYPTGRRRWVSYAGCHSWAIPTTCADPARAAEAIAGLVSEEAARHDAAGGSVPAHAGVLDQMDPADAVDAERLAITRRTIAEAMITFPPLSCFPVIEDACSQALNQALRGRLRPDETVRVMQAAAAEALGA